MIPSRPLCRTGLRSTRVRKKVRKIRCASRRLGSGRIHLWGQRHTSPWAAPAAPASARCSCNIVVHLIRRAIEGANTQCREWPPWVDRLGEKAFVLRTSCSVTYYSHICIIYVRSIESKPTYCEDDCFMLDQLRADPQSYLQENARHGNILRHHYSNFGQPDRITPATQLPCPLVCGREISAV